MERNKGAFLCTGAFPVWEPRGGISSSSVFFERWGEGCLPYCEDLYLLLTFVLSFSKTLISFISAGSRDCFFFCIKQPLLILYLKDPFFTNVTDMWNMNMVYSNHTFICSFIHFLAELLTYLPKSFEPFAFSLCSHEMDFYSYLKYAKLLFTLNHTSHCFNCLDGSSLLQICKADFLF